MRASILIIAILGLQFGAYADTTDQTWQSTVVVAKQGAHCVDDKNCFNRYHPRIPPVARAKPGDAIVFHTRDALDSDLTLDSNADDLAAVDLNLVHPMTGPVHIEGARRGDVLAVTLLDIEPDQYGYTVIVPGFGFLRDIYTEPHLVNWRVSRTHAESDQMPGVRVPYEAFMGSVGVLPGENEVERWLLRETVLASMGGIALPPEPTGALPSAVCGPQAPYKDECLRTIPPRENGGNMDVQQMQVGTTLLLPCFIDGCGLFVGDVHYAQGDGEVSGTAIEMGAVVRVSTEIRKGMGRMIKGPEVEGGAQIKNMEPSQFYQTIGYPIKAGGEVPAPLKYLESEKIKNLENLSEDLTLAARDALIKMIAYIQREYGLSAEQAYILASVAVDLRVGQVVDVPNYVVTAVLNEDVFVNPRRHLPGMLRRTFVRAGIGLIGGCAWVGIPARAHTPYRQWVVYRRKHLLIGCHRQDPETYALARRMVAVLEARLPAARARVARAPTPGRLASLLGTDQLDVALLAHADASAMAAGRERFAAYGKIALHTLFLHPKYALVGRAGLPARHAWLIAHALHESEVDLPLAADASPPLAWHDGVRSFIAGQPPPDPAVAE